MVVFELDIEVDGSLFIRTKAKLYYDITLLPGNVVICTFPFKRIVHPYKDLHIKVH